MAHKGNIPWNKGVKRPEHSKFMMEHNPLSMLGKKHSEKTKKIMSQKATGRVGDKNGNWKGGRRKDGSGYIWIYLPNHPSVNEQGYVYEHRLVMETHLGRILLPTEVVHHINGIVDDNRYENLMLFSGTGEHISFHFKEKRRQKCLTKKPLLRRI